MWAPSALARAALSPSVPRTHPLLFYFSNFLRAPQCVPWTAWLRHERAAPSTPAAAASTQHRDGLGAGPTASKPVCLPPHSSLLVLGQPALNLAKREIAKDCAKINHRRCAVEVQPSKTHGSLEPQITKASWFSKRLRLCVCKRRVPQGTLPKEGRVGVKCRLLNTAPSTFTHPGNCRPPKDVVNWQSGRCRHLSQLCSDTGGTQGLPCHRTPSPAPQRVSAHQGQKGISHSPATSCSHSPSTGNDNLGNIPLLADFTFQNTSILCSLF